MNSQSTKRILVPVYGITFSAFTLVLVWIFRFLPLYDYPIWLYNVHVMGHISDPMFASTYEFTNLPVPNLGLVGPVWILSHWFPIEIAGKIFLSMCLLIFQWGFFYCFQTVSENKKSVLAVLGFPLSFGYFFYSSHAFLLSLGVSLFVIGFFLPKMNSLNLKAAVLLSCSLMLLYFIHLLGLVIASLLIVGSQLRPLNGRSIRGFVLAALPSAVLLSWYLVGRDGESNSGSSWSVWFAAQSVLKPVLPFVKSFGIENVLPLSLLNLVWILLIGIFFLSGYVQAMRKNILDKRFVLSFVFSACLGVFLPGEFLGIVQPGIRFVFVAVLAGALMINRAQFSMLYSYTLMIFSLSIVAYNGYHFARVDNQMNELYRTIESSGIQGKSFASVRVDWPTEFRLWDGLASPFHPLFGSIYYAGLHGGGPAWIFETALLTKQSGDNDSIRDGGTVDDYTRSVVSDFGRRRSIDMLLITGKSSIMNHVVAGLQEAGAYHLSSSGDSWRLLVKMRQ